MIAGETDSDCYAGHKENGHDGDHRRDTDDSDGVGDNGEVMALVAEVKERRMMQILMGMMVRAMVVKAVKIKMAMNDGDCGVGDVDC